MRRNCIPLSLLLMVVLASTSHVEAHILSGGARQLTLVLPQKLVAGESATLAVIGEGGRLVPDVQVEFSGDVRFTTDSTGRARFRAPSATGVLLAQIPGSTATASATVLAAGSAAKLAITDVPHILSMRDRFNVNGTGFSGDADANSVQLGSKPAVVIAASPINLVVVAGPGTAPGPTRLVISASDANGPSVTEPVTLVSVEFAPSKPHLATKEKAKLIIQVRGSEEPLDLEARNLAPEVVRFRRGDLQRIRTRGGADNSATLEIEGRSAGDYSFSVRVVPLPTGAPDTEAARQYLLAAGRLAPPRDSRRVGKLVRQLERKPEDALKVRNTLEKMLAAKPAGEYGRLLESAWEVLLNR